MSPDGKGILGRISEGKCLVADGAMGTMLFERGVKGGQAPESINLERPEILEDIARLYLEAGADVLQTNTFGASVLKLSSHSLADRTEDINRKAVDAVRKVAGDRAFVAASCGPSGKLLVPYGDTEPEVIYESFARQLKAVIEAGVDVVCVETMTDLAEASLAVKAARSVSSTIPIIATMTFDPGPRGFFTVMGVSIEKAAAGLEEAGADVVGSNCGNGIEKMIEIAREFKNVSSLPIIIQSNAGMPELRDGAPVYPESPEFMAERAKALVDMGVAVIGGCCGTTPEHTRALREMVDSQAC